MQFSGLCLGERSFELDFGFLVNYCMLCFLISCLARVYWPSSRLNCKEIGRFCLLIWSLNYWALSAAFRVEIDCVSVMVSQL